MLDHEFIQLIESKRLIIHPDLDRFVLETFDKLEALTSTLISHIHDAYLQQSVELAALTATASEISTQSSITVNTPSFATISPILTTTVHSPKPVIHQPSSPSSISYPSSSRTSPTTSTSPPSQARIQAMVDRYAPLVLPAQPHAMHQDYQRKIFLFDCIGQYTAQ